ncbi:MAG: Do family serine endopeptidase [Spirochaetaceae bacterium]|nr:MAG: Do family serine endopeptidase [Spirochaetaceae bacterium]
MNGTITGRSKKVLFPVIVLLSLAVGFATAGFWFTMLAGRDPGVAAAYPQSDVSFQAIPADYNSGPINSSTSLGTLQSLQQAFREVAAKVLPTVVEIDVVDVVKQQVPGFTNPFEFFFGPQSDNRQAPQQQEFRRQGLGSGVIVRHRGNKVYVLTNNHVAGEAEEISVKLNDGRQFTAQLVGADPNRDLALVMFETTEQVPVAQLGDSDVLQVGDWVLAVGSPLGFDSTVTAGIVSAIGRHTIPGMEVANFTDYIQTDAAINQGNSGGALVNIYGQVVGINSWIASPSGGNVGLGFAIPINNAKKAIDDFITKGKIEYGWLGVSMGSVSTESLKDLKLQNSRGAFVYGVFKGSPADKAGVLPGDFITEVNGEALRDTSELLLRVGNLEPGKKADLSIIRYGQSLRLTVKIAARESEQNLAARSGKLWPGFSVVPLTEDIRTQLSLNKSSGRLVIGAVEQGGFADIAGLKTGDIVRKVNGQEVSTVLDFYKAFNSTKSREILFAIKRQDTELVIGLVL